MRKARWLVDWRDSASKPAIYHCISRVVDRRFVFGDEEREMFRMFMRMYENFSGCRILSYCVMSNHFHLLLEVPPMPEGGLDDAALLKRLDALYSEGFVAGVAAELRAARKGEDARISGDSVPGDSAVVTEVGSEWRAIHDRFTPRMHDLSQFMKGLLIRFTRWFNRKHSRKGTLWEERFKSVIVESGIAARTMAAYIDLNPVRAGMVADPADYRWSSYGEAIGGGGKGTGKKAREGLVRACVSHEGIGFEAGKWDEVSAIYRRLLGMALEKKAGRHRSEGQSKLKTKNRQEALESSDPETQLGNLGEVAMLRCRIRYFTEGAVIGSRAFVDEAFRSARSRFGPNRRDGARKLKGDAGAAAGILWSMRDLRVAISASQGS